MPPGQATTSGQALTNLQNFQSQMKSPTDILTQQQQQLGIPGQQQQVSGLRQAITNTTNLLNQVAPSVYGRTQNSLVTNAQAGRQIQNEQAPISTELQNQGQQYSGAQSDLDRALQQAAQMSSLQVSGNQQSLDNLKSIYGSLYQQEQDAAAHELQQQQLNLQKQAAARAGSGGLNGLFDNNQSTNTNQNNGLPPGMTAKSALGNGSSGYNFVVNNQPASAAQFASANKIPLGDLLYNMAQGGDNTAASAYKWIQSIQNTDLFKSGKYKSTPAYKNYSSLLWGT